MSDDLVKRLRAYDELEQDRDGQIICQKCEITHEAADRIEQLERELSISRMAQVVMDNTVETLTAERDAARIVIFEQTSAIREAALREALEAVNAKWRSGAADTPDEMRGLALAEAAIFDLIKNQT